MGDRESQINIERVTKMTEEINKRLETGMTSAKVITERDKVLYKMAFLSGVTTGMEIATGQ